MRIAIRKVAKVLGVTAEAMKNYSDEAVINNIQNNYEDSNNQGANNINNYNCTFNSLDELIKALNANNELYERLFASEKEKVEILKNK